MLEKLRKVFVTIQNILKGLVIDSRCRYETFPMTDREERLREEKEKE